MKKTVLCILAAGALVFTTLPVNSQQTATVPKEKPKTQATAKPAEKAKATTPVAAAQTAPVAVTTAPKPAAKPSTGVAAATTPASVTPVAATTNAAAPAKVASPAPPAPAIPLTCTWDVTDYDFGKNVIQSKPASATFTLTNAGKEPVTINQVSTSCGCTAPKYSKEPIKPGEKGEVVLTYNAAISGPFGKSAQVKLNDGQNYTLTIKGDVQKVEQTPATPATVK